MVYCDNTTQEAGTTMNDIDPVERAKALTPPYVPSSAGIPPAPSGTPYAEVQPISPAERDRLAAEYFGEHVAPATGWYTVPGFVRVAVWLWALVTVLGFAAGLLFSLVWVVILMVTLGAQ